MKVRRLLILLIVACAAKAQSVNSGSTGADGGLVLTSPGTMLFDPRTFNPPLNPSGDNVYHFTFVNIGKDVTVRLSAKNLNGPVFWLVQGPVQIDGTIELDGADGERTPSLAGAGGYPGGAVRGAGYGPGESFKSNVFLVPLVGGSGGDGGQIQGGGAGGGALLIASSASITLNGAITANGGASADGTGGNGGAMRLVAPVIGGSGLLSARRGSPRAADGLIRFETFQNEFSGNLNDSPSVQGRPFGLFLPPTPQGSVRIVSIGGVPVAGEDFTVNQASAVLVTIEARFISPGTVIELEVFPESGPSQIIATTPLQGSFELSRAAASVDFPRGLSRSHVKAIWKQPARGEQKP